MLKKVAYTLMPVRRDEIKKCISMGMMMFFILFNYDLLRSLKDSLIVANIGPEAVTFVKMYVITPAALSFMLLYTYLSERLSFEKIFYCIAAFFLIFFLIFGFIIYPNQSFFHPNPATISRLINSEINLFFLKINLDHFKWFIKLYGKWSFVLYYVIAELWGSAMLFMLFWQFANRTTSTEEAKRLYPVYAFIGHIGAALSGFCVGLLSSAKAGYFMYLYMTATSICTILASVLFTYNYQKTKARHFQVTAFNKAGKLRAKLSLLESLKIILSSRYLGLIIVIVLAYGTCVNLIEGLWRARMAVVFTDTIVYTKFMGKIILYIGLGSMIGMIISGPILRIFGWLTGALITPVVMLTTGVIFFAFFLFGNYLEPYFAPYGINIPFVAAVVGAIQGILTKTFKYSLFDITKEMAFIPAGEHLRSKGKAAIDIVGQRWAKSIGSLVQSSLFIIFPMATYDTIAPFLIVICIVVMLMWIFSTAKLNTAYLQKVEEHKIRQQHT